MTPTPTPPVAGDVQRQAFEAWWQTERLRTWVEAGCDKRRGPTPSAGWAASEKPGAWRGWQACAALSAASAAEPQGWISVDEVLPAFADDAEDDGVKVYTWDGQFVAEDEFMPEYEQPAGPVIGGWVRAGEWFASDSMHRVTHWMPRRMPPAPGASQVHLLQGETEGGA